jgi:hypothetical protein
MPTAYSNPASTLDRPFGPGEFARYAETSAPGAIEEAQYMAPPEPQLNYSSHPGLQAEAARQAASDLALSSDQFRVPQSTEVERYAEQVHAEAVAATLTGGVENMLSRGDRELSAAEINARFDDIAANERARDAMAPSQEAIYSADGALLEAYNSGCAVISVRNAQLQGAELN